MNPFGPADSYLLFQGAPREVKPRLVEIRTQSIRSRHPYHDWSRIRDMAKSRFAFAQIVVCLFTFQSVDEDFPKQSQLRDPLFRPSPPFTHSLHDDGVVNPVVGKQRDNQSGFDTLRSPGFPILLCPGRQICQSLDGQKWFPLFDDTFIAPWKEIHQVDISRYLFYALVVQSMADTNSLLSRFHFQKPATVQYKKIRNLAQRSLDSLVGFAGWLLHKLSGERCDKLLEPQLLQKLFPGAPEVPSLKPQRNDKQRLDEAERRTNNDVPLIESPKGGLSKNHYASRW